MSGQYRTKMIRGSPHTGEKKKKKRKSQENTKKRKKKPHPGNQEQQKATYLDLGRKPITIFCQPEDIIARKRTATYNEPLLGWSASCGFPDPCVGRRQELARRGGGEMTRRFLLERENQTKARGDLETVGY